MLNEKKLVAVRLTSGISTSPPPSSFPQLPTGLIKESRFACLWITMENCPRPPGQKQFPGLPMLLDGVLLRVKV